MTVQTVTGPVDSARLGRVLMHEHLIVVDLERARNYPELGQPWDEERAVAHAVSELRRMREAGFDTLVDVSVAPMGRDLPRVRAIAEHAQVNVVAATGLYFFDTLPGPYAGLRCVDGEDPIAEMMVRDIVEGSAGTGIRAGIIKCAVDVPGLTPDVVRVLRACATAHHRTGVSITTHTHAASRTGLLQQEVLAQAGVDLSRVVIGHCDDTTDLDYHEALLANGSYLGMDRLELDTGPPRADRLATVAELCARGYADRLVLSHDTAAFVNWGTAAEGMAPDTYLRIAREVLPALRERGVTDAHIEEMLVANPRRVLDRVA